MKKIFFALLSLSILISSCGKGKKNKETICTEDNNKADICFNDIFNITSTEVQAVEEAEGINKNESILASLSDSCASITYSLDEDSTYIDTLIVDYGNNTTCTTNGRVRRGKLNIYLTGRFREAGTVTTIVPEDFYVDDHKVEGQKVITNNGLVGGLNWSFDVDVTNGQITNPDGNTFQWECSRTNIWRILEGEIGISGVANGVNRNGVPFDLVVTQELVIMQGCQWITSGIFELTPEDLATRTVDYGSGTCDNNVTVTINNNLYNINLP